MDTGRVRSDSSPTRPAIPYCVTLGLVLLAHLFSGPCQLLNYQFLMKGQEKEAKEEVGVTQASAFGVLGQACLQPGEGPYSPPPPHEFLSPIIRIEERMEKGKVPTLIPRNHQG